LRHQCVDELLERLLVTAGEPCQNERSDQCDCLSDCLPELRRSVLECERDDLIVVCRPKLLSHLSRRAGERFERYRGCCVRINRCHESIRSNMLDMDIA